MTAGLHKRRALVTGADGGLGSAIVSGLAREGVDLALHVRSEGQGVQALAEARRHGVRAEVVHGELPQDAASVVARAAEVLGGLDIVVNNAGTMSRTGVLDMPEEEWRSVIDTNLTGYFLVAQAAARLMVEAGRGGAIVNVSSTRQVQSWPGGSAYAASKGGIAMLTRSLALELAPLGIRVNSIAPGTIETDLNRDYVSEPEFKAQRVGTIPAGRYGTPEDVVGAVLYLVSDAAAFTIGTSIFIDGGQTLW